METKTKTTKVKTLRCKVCSKKLKTFEVNLCSCKEDVCMKHRDRISHGCTESSKLLLPDKVEFIKVHKI